METKKESFTPGYLRPLTDNVPFEWFYLPVKKVCWWHPGWKKT